MLFGFNFSSCAPVDLTNKLAAELFFFMLVLDWENNWPYNSTMMKCSLLKSFNGPDLLENYDQFLETLFQIDYITCNEQALPIFGGDGGKWMFQTCNELGYYVASDPIQGVFGFDSFSGEGWGQDCKRYFGPEFVFLFQNAFHIYTLTFKSC